MRTGSIKSGIFLIGILIHLSIIAQKPLNYRFQYLLSEDGLPQNTISVIAKDQYNFMWFGTNNGLCRYDGFSFETFQPNHNQNTYPDNMISSIETGTDNRLWIGAKNGLFFFDTNSEEIVKFHNTDSLFPAIERVSSIEVNQNEVWVGTSTNGVFLLSSNAKNNYEIKTHFCTQNRKLSNNSINTIYKNSSNEIFIGTNNEVFVYKNMQFTQQIKNINLPRNTFVNDIFESTTHDLYISTFNGLAILRNEAQSFEWFFLDPTSSNSLVHNTVNEVREDSHGNILIGSLGGLQIFNPQNNQFIAFPEEGSDHFKLNNQFINTLFCDSNGNVWIGTEKGGINKYNLYQNQFNFYANNPNNPNSLNENTINSILKEENNLWVGTAGGGLNKLNYSNNKFSHYKFDALNENSISSDYITSIARSENGELWAGSWGGGLNRIKNNGNSTDIQRINQSSPGYQNEIVDYFVSCILPDKRDFLLIGTQGGLATLDYKSKKFTTLLAPESFDVPLSEIGCLMLDSKDFYWVGTRNGLFRFPANNIRKTLDNESIISQLQFFKNTPLDSTSLSGNYIASLLEDSNGDIWVGTYGKGICKVTITPDDKLVSVNYTQEHGLSNNVIYGIQEDQYQNLWISTDYGLNLFEKEKLQIRNFFKQDGLMNNQFYWSASYKSKDGELYFGGTEGLNYFKPEEIAEYKHLAVPRITKLKVHNKEVNVGDVLHDLVVINKPIYLSDTIQLSYRDNNVSFDFSAFDYYLPEKTSFAYQLSEIDNDWIQVPAQRRFANYSNLSGGTYTFSLKAANCDGLWNETPTVITLIIKPPFWKTRWFTILIIVSVSLLTFFIIQLQMRRIIQQRKILEEKVRLRTKKIEDQKIILEKQAEELIHTNHQLEHRQTQIEHQKEELEDKNDEISTQRDELIVLNDKVKEVNHQQMRFFTNISHEFRTPLTLILSPIERLLKLFHQNEEANGMLKIVNRNAERLLLLINQLLEIRKIETGNQELQVELCDANDFLLDIFDSFSNLAQKNNINYQHNISLSKVAWIDKEKLENVLYNLLSNAFKFTPSDKEISLEAINVHQNETDFLEISVIDNGQGISAQKIDKLFDRFYQVTETKTHKNAGTGIGLSLVKSLVEIMHGTIHVDSEMNKGSKFTIRIPINKSFFAVHEIDTTGQVFESDLPKRIAVLHDQIATETNIDTNHSETDIDKILVVEDNQDMRSFICSNLSEYYKIIEAENGKEGYELAKKEEPSLIISDIMMPEMNGLELCKKTKGNLYTSHIPVILLTAKGNIKDQLEGLEQGADDYIPKPFNIEILIAKVTSIIDTRKKLRNKFSKLEEIGTSDINISALDDSFLLKVNEIVDKYYSDPSFDVDQFASEMFVSRSQLYKKMKALTNLSANDFINVYRLKKSVEMLQLGTLQISEIAYSIGFNDPKYFSRIFKKFYKKSPSEFIRKTST